MTDTQDDMQNMTPEQAAAMQKQQCIFCQIIDGKVASKRVYEDEKCVVIMDINPANPGHVLILPKEHYAIMPLMPETDIAHLFSVAKKISKVQLATLQATGTNVFAANGAAAGQKAPHFMLHVIPRKENDGITAFTLPKNQIGEEDQNKLRVAIKEKVNAQFGIYEEKEETVQADKPAPEQVSSSAPQETEELSVPPPEPDEEEFEKHKEEAQKEPKEKKKTPDLDTISKLFG